MSLLLALFVLLRLAAPVIPADTVGGGPAIVVQPANTVGGGPVDAVQTPQPNTVGGGPV
jgi:hypothetical protein